MSFTRWICNKYLLGLDEAAMNFRFGQHQEYK